MLCKFGKAVESWNLKWSLHPITVLQKDSNTILPLHDLIQKTTVCPNLPLPDQQFSADEETAADLHQWVIHLSYYIIHLRFCFGNRILPCWSLESQSKGKLFILWIIICLETLNACQQGEMNWKKTSTVQNLC